MARSGRFGRLPRNAPDLTGTIVALLREYQQQREQNVTDAWKNGGTFEGKKATDEMLLQFYRDKMEGVSKDDPLYEETKNTVQQYTFAIANSKMELKYAQGDVGPGGMARFYRKWAGTLPRNSEAWRQMMKSAAQYADHARASAASGASQAKENALHNREQRIYNRNEAGFDMVSGVLQSIAEQGRLLAPGETSIADLRPGQVEVGDFMRMVEAWNQSTDPFVKADRARLTAEIQKVDPDFNGDFSYANLQAMSANKSKGVKQRWDMWVHAGRKTEANAVAKEWTKTNNVVAIINSHDEFAQYEAARELWETKRNNPMADAIDQQQADEEYKATLQRLQTTIPTSMQPGYAGNYLHGGLQIEIDALDGKSSPNPTWHEDAVTLTTTGALAAGEKGGDANTGGLSDAEGTAKTHRAAAEDVAKLALRDPNTGLPVYALAHADSNGNPVAGTSGAIRAVPVSAMTGIGYAYQPTASRVVTVQQVDPQTGEVTTAQVSVAPAHVVVGENISAQGVEQGVPGAQRPVGPLETTGQAQNIGERYTRDDGTSIYGYWSPDGKHYFSTVNPFIAQPTAGKSGLTINVPGATGSMVPATDALAPLNKVQAGGLYRDALKTDERGGTTSGGMRPQMNADFSVTMVPSTSFRSYAVADAATRPNGMEWLRDPANRDSIRNAIAGEAGNDPAVLKDMTDEWYGLQRQQADRVEGAARMRRAEQMDERPMPVDVATRGRQFEGKAPQDATYDPQKDLQDSSRFPGYARQRLVDSIDQFKAMRPASSTEFKTKTPAQRLAEQQRMMTLNVLEQQLQRGDQVLRDQQQQQRAQGFGLTKGQADTMGRMYTGNLANPRLGPTIPAGLKPPAPKPPAPKVKPPKAPKLRRTDLSVTSQPHVWSSEPTAL